MDPGMPDRTDATTAHTIRTKIYACPRFVLLASDRALSSRWVPWELGYSDAVKGLSHIAILPVKDTASDYTGNEYLQIYSAIKSTTDDDFAVFAPGEKQGTPLSRWIVA